MSQAAKRTTVTQMDLARRLGLSGATISLALRGSPKISETRRAEILKAATELGYRPNAAATALAQSRKNSKIPQVQATIAWINYWKNPKELRQLAEYNSYWLGAVDSAEKLGYRLEEFQAYGMSPVRLCQILRSRGIEGILLPPHIKPADWSGFEWQHFAIVRLGRSLQEPYSHIVTANQVANMILAFERTQQKGYQRIGFITSLPDPKTALFDAGFLRAQRQIPTSQHVPICSIPETDDDIAQATIQQWMLTHKPDAILTNVQRVPAALKAAGIQVPKDVAFASLSTLDIDSDSGIYQNPKIIGQVAVHKVVSLINTNTYGIPNESNETQVNGSWVDGSEMPNQLGAAEPSHKE